MSGLSGVALTCGCLNGATCRQRIQLLSETVYTIATDVTSFVAPGHSHQLYCACNLGFAGTKKEKLYTNLCYCLRFVFCKDVVLFSSDKTRQFHGY